MPLSNPFERVSIGITVSEFLVAHSGIAGIDTFSLMAMAMHELRPVTASTGWRTVDDNMKRTFLLDAGRRSEAPTPQGVVSERALHET